MNKCAPHPFDPDEVPTVCDVLVVGSGMAGLVAACRAADAGHDVLLLERTDSVGGSTAISGGVIWVPGNHLMAPAGYSDSPADALAYVEATTGGSVPRHRLEWFLRTAPEAVRYLCEHTDVGLVPLGRPDYRADAPGAVSGGRALDNLPFEVGEHPLLASRLRAATYLPAFTMVEREEGRGVDLVAAARERDARGARTMGGALAGALVVSALARSVRIVTGARVIGLDPEGGWSAQVTRAGGTSIVKARTAVVLASGGFEWNEKLQRAFLPAPVLPISAPGNEGDGLLMGLRAGAAVTGMTASWGVPAFQDPATDYEGLPTGRLANAELTRPGSIMVNPAGQRFVDEASSYHELTKVFREVDTATGRYRHSPAWMVYDATYRDRYSVAGTAPGGTPGWAVSGDSLADLSKECGIDSSGLQRTVAEFNEDAATGTDRHFARGTSLSDRHLGDPTVEPNPCLAPLVTPPFTAVRVHAATLGTSGGLETDNCGRVLDSIGDVVEGLFAAGNVSASIFGDSYPGGGTSLAAALARAFSLGAELGR